MKLVALWLPVLLVVFAQAQNNAITGTGIDSNATATSSIFSNNLSAPLTAVSQSAAGSASSSEYDAASQNDVNGVAGTDNAYSSANVAQDSAASSAAVSYMNTTADWSSSHTNSDAATQGCVGSPSQESCRSYEYSNDRAIEDMRSICSSNAYLSGCSIFRLCTQTTTDQKAIAQTPDICDNFKLLATVCGNDSLADDQQGCSNYKSLCLSEDSTVQQCHISPGLQHIVPTAAARQLSRSICEGPRTPADCRRCDWSSSQPACDFLSVYGALCTASPDMSECTVWRDMCSADPTLYVCRGQQPGGQPAPAGVAKLFMQSPSPPVWTSGGLVRGARGIGCQGLTWAAAVMVVAAVLL